MAPKKSSGNFGGKRAAPFKGGGGRDRTHPNTAKGTPRRAGGGGRKP